MIRRSAESGVGSGSHTTAIPDRAAPVMPIVGRMTGPPAYACPACGSTEFEEGFIDDVSNGRVRWLAGPIKMGVFNTRKMGRARRIISAWRCGGCNRLELIAAPDPNSY